MPWWFGRASADRAAQANRAAQLLDEAHAREVDAARGVEARANWEAASALYRQAGAIYGSGPDFAHCLMCEGTARWRLVDLGVDARANLGAAIALYQQARAVFGSGPNLATCLTYKATARRRLADLGVGPVQGAVAQPTAPPPATAVGVLYCQNCAQPGAKRWEWGFFDSEQCQEAYGRKLFRKTFGSESEWKYCQKCARALLIEAQTCLTCGVAQENYR